MKVRLLKEDEVDVALQQRLAYFRNDNRDLENPVLIDNLRRYFEASLNRECFVSVVEVDDKIVSVAMLCYIHRPPHPVFISGNTGLLMNVLTDIDYRRRGYGIEAVKVLIEKAKTLRLDYITLQATSDGKYLYEALEFVKFEQEFDEMRLKLRY